MQVVVNDLPVDEKVNVVGMVVEEDVPLLPYIGAEKSFNFFCAIERKLELALFYKKHYS